VSKPDALYFHWWQVLKQVPETVENEGDYTTGNTTRNRIGKRDYYRGLLPRKEV